jgi:hypothetical protein
MVDICCADFRIFDCRAGAPFSFSTYSFNFLKMLPSSNVRSRHTKIRSRGRVLLDNTENLFKRSRKLRLKVRAKLKRRSATEHSTNPPLGSSN